MGRNRVLCEIEPESRKIVRILRFGGTALFLRPEQVIELPKVEAVKQVRDRVYELSKGDCRNCAASLSYPNGFHMHELKTRGAGGEISIFNSVALCADCHLNQEHGDRKPQWSKG